MASGKGQGRLTESRVTLSQSAAITTITNFYSKEAGETSASPAKKKSKNSKRKKEVMELDSSSPIRETIDLSSPEPVKGGEALASVLGLPDRVM